MTSVNNAPGAPTPHQRSWSGFSSGLGSNTQGPYTSAMLGQASGSVQSILGVPVRTGYDQGVLAIWSEANQYVTRQHFQVWSSRFPAEQTQNEMMCMIGCGSINPTLKLGIQSEHEIPSVYSFNKYMVSSEGRRRYGIYNTSDVVLNDFLFLGAQKGANQEYEISANARCQTYVVGKRIRTPDITRAYYSRKHTGGPENSAVVYWLLRRCNLIEEWKRKGDYVTANSPSVLVNPYYWRMCIYVNNEGRAPIPALYSDESYVGASIYVGFISDNLGNVKQHVAHMTKVAREVLDPLTKVDLGEALTVLPPIEMMLFVK